MHPSPPGQETSNTCQELYRLPAIHDPMIIREHVHHRADDDLTVARDRAIGDPVEAQDPHLWRPVKAPS